MEKLTTFRFLISLVARKDWNADHLDVVTAILNPEVDNDTVFMQLPEGWPDGKFREIDATTIIRLNTALYGLKQAAPLWY